MTMAASARRSEPAPRSCANADGTPKRMYDSRAGARKAAHGTRGGVKEYACPVCPFWHVGHSSRRDPR
jgi:hypothetical protein